jgi:WD40 repeat protein
MRAPSLAASLVLVLSAAIPAIGEEPRTDLVGDPLPEGVIMRLGSIRFRQRTKLFQSEVSFAPDCKTLAVTCSDEAGSGVLLLDVATGKVIRRLDVPGNVKLGEVVFSPDGKLLLAVGERELFILETDKDSTFGRFLKRDGASCFAFLPDHKSLVAAGGHERNQECKPVRIWSFLSGLEIGRLEGINEPVTELRVSADGKQLTCYGSGLISVCDLLSRKVISQHKVKKEVVWVSQDLKIGLEDHFPFDPMMYHVWDLESDKELLRLGHNQNICSLSPEGHILYVTKEDIRLLHVPSGRVLQRFENSYGLDYCRTHFSPDGKLLAVWPHWGDRQKGHSFIRLWDVATGKELLRTGGHQRAICWLAISADGRRTVSGGEDKTVRLWETRTGKELRVYTGHEAYVRGVALSPDGRCVASMDRESGLHLWDAQTGKLKAIFSGEQFQNGLYPVGFTQDGKKLLAQDGSRAILVLDSISGKIANRIELGVPADTVIASPNGRLLAAVETDDESRYSITVRDTSTGKVHYTIKAEDRETLFNLAFSRDGKFLAARRYMNPDLKIGATIHIRPEHHEFRIWEVASAKEVNRIKLPYPPSTYVFSPDGGGLIAPFSKTNEDLLLQFWNLVDSWTGQVPAGHLDCVSCLALSADGRTLVSGSVDGTILVRDTAHISLIRRYLRGDLSTEDMAKLWIDLNGDDGKKMQDAIGILAESADSTLPFLREHVAPTTAGNSQRIRHLIDELDSNSFRVREQASGELERLAELAESALRKALESSPSVEAKRRIERLLVKLETPLLSGAQLQAVRVTTLLERIGTSEARRLLEDLAKGAPEARLTREAKASLERLSNQP